MVAQSRHSQHRSVLMAKAVFHAAPSKGHDFKGCTGLAMGSQPAFKGAGYTHQNGSVIGRQEELQEQCLHHTEGI